MARSLVNSATVSSAAAIAQDAHECTPTDADGREGGPKVAYDAFISYSHAKDKAIATALQSVVQKLGKAWYRRRALRVFRDDTSLSATPQLWPSIERALSRSRFLILLASPGAAASPWVQKEVTWWLDHKSVDTILIALTEGELGWDDAASDFGWSESTPLPPVLEHRFSAEPRWIDLRTYREANTPNGAEFMDLAADFAAAIHRMAAAPSVAPRVVGGCNTGRARGCGHLAMARCRNKDCRGPAAAQQRFGGAGRC